MIQACIWIVKKWLFHYNSSLDATETQQHTQDGNLAQLLRAPIGFQHVVVQMADTVWHVKEGGSTHSIHAGVTLLQDLHVTGMSMAC